MPVLKNIINKLDPDYTYFGFAGLLVILLGALNFFDPINLYSYTRDVWHHLAALNALMESPLNATNPHIASDDPSRTFMPWFVLMALLGKAFSLNASQVLGVSAFFTLTTLVFGIRLFAREYFQKSWAPLVLLVCLLGGWGMELEHVGPSNIETLLFSIGYPAYIILALGFFAWWAVLKFINTKEKRTWYLALIVAFCAFAFPTHQLQTGFVFGTMGVFALFSKNGSLKNGALVGLAAFGGLALSTQWFYYNPVEFLISSTGYAGWKTFEIWYEPQFIIFSVGVGYFGLLGFYDDKTTRWRRDLVFGFSAIFLGFLAGNLFDSSISHRFYPFWVMYLHLGLTWFILSRCPGLKWKAEITRLNFLHSLAIFTLVISASFHFYKSIGDYMSFQDTGKNSRLNLMEVALKMPDYFRPGDVLVAQAETAYPAQAVGLKVVSIPRPFPLVPDMVDRQQASRDFFNPEISNQKRLEIIKKYNITHILYQQRWTGADFRNNLDGFGEKHPLNDDLVLISIDLEQNSVPNSPSEGEGTRGK